MKKKVIAIFSCGILMLAAAGCGTSQTETTGTMNEVAVREESVDEATYAGDNDSSDMVCDVNTLSEAQQHMLGPMDSAAYAMNVATDNYSYDWNNDEYVWEALYCLICNYRDSLIKETDAVTYESGYLYVTEDFLKECASAMFVDFNGQIPASGSNAIKEGNRYKFGVGDRGDEYACISSWIEHSDGTCTVETQIGIASTGELMQTFRFELVKNVYTESEDNPYYVYSIASAENIYNGAISSNSDITINPDDYILPDSDTRYYTESELSGLSKDDLRFARNEIYARHGRKFDSEDLQKYFDGKAWYNGTIEPSDFSEDILNDYEKKNIQVIESLENATGQNTTNSTSSSEFLFASLDGKDFAYGSGHGAWATTLNIYADGTFSGVFSDWNGGDADETHPNGEYDYCEFSGKFSEPKKIDDYAYSATVEYIDQAYESGTSEIKDGCLYNYTDPFGIAVGDEFMIYLPGTLIEELPESYVNQKYITSTLPESLSSYGLFNATEAAVFG